MVSIEREIERVVHRALKESQLSGGAPIGIMDGIEAFIAAINWSEPFIVGIVCVHITFLILAIGARRHNNIQIGLLILALAGVLSASSINEYGAKNWKQIGTTQVWRQHHDGSDNYFDKFGIFTSLLISAPLIVMSFGILIYAITRASSLLIEVKRLELTKNRSSTQKNKKEGTTTSQADTNEKKDNTTTTTTTTRVETTTNQGGSTTASEGNSTRKRK